MILNRKSWVRAICLLVVFVFSSCGTHAQDNARRDKETLQINRALDIYKELLPLAVTYYVDTIDIKKVTSIGINAMLSQFDPYTEYIAEDDSEAFKLLTTGAYGGIGSYIQLIDSIVYVREPMPNSPSTKVGLRVGDAFVEIDGKSVIPGTPAEVSKMLKGPVGTSVNVKIRRIGEKKLREFVIKRDQVVVDQVYHSGMYQDSIGFIRLSSFTTKSAEDVRDTYLQLQKSGNLKGLILDLRSNGGGVLEGAIDILSMFLPKNTKVVYTKGRLPQTSSDFFTQNAPIDVDIPIVVLINGGSASASEIVAGAMQDLDRAVLVGTKSFGKGLVQTTRPLYSNGILKVTTSRYYIPSGRCIQQLDYSHRNPDGSVAAVPDSLTQTFYTKNGRAVRDGGGIRPDVEIKDETISGPLFKMMREGTLFKFARDLYQEHPTPKSIEEVRISDAEYDRYLAFLKDERFEYGELTHKALKQLKEIAEYEGYDSIQMERAFKGLADALRPDIDQVMVAHKAQVKNLLRGTLATFYFGEKSQFEINLATDPSFQKALQLLANPSDYRKLLLGSESKKDDIKTEKQ